MKAKYTLLALLFSTIVFSQSGINYKAVIKDGAGNILANQTVTLQFTILENTTIVYSELHSPTTDANGIVVVNIGEGTLVTGSYAGIEWGKADHFLKIEMDDGAGGALDLGTTALKHVPYALHAENVTGLEALDEGNGIGHRIIGRNLNNLGDIGLNAVDLSTSPITSTSYGATGENSFAANSQTTAEGRFATAFGLDSKAYGNTSLVMGFNTRTFGYDAVAMGAYTVAEASQSLAIGRYNLGGGNNQVWVSTDPVFEIGIGMNNANRFNALTVLKNGIISAPSLTNALINLGGNKSLIHKEYLDNRVDNLSIDSLTDGKSDNDGTQNGSSIFLGIDAGLNDDGTNNANVGIGLSSLAANTTGSSNIAVGHLTLNSNSVGNSNIGIGTRALFSNTSGSRNVGVGVQSLTSILTANDNSGLGYQSLFNNTIGNRNVGVGYRSLFSNIDGNDNVAIGYAALFNAANGSKNIAIGSNALLTHSAGEDNVAIGNDAIRSGTIISRTTAIGANALSSLTDGGANTAVGFDALSATNSGALNVAVGNAAMKDNTTGSGNTACGVESLYRNTSGNSNTAYGDSALRNNLTGNQNTAVGLFAMYNSSTGSNNTAIGYNTQVPVETNSNQVRIGNLDVTYAGVQVAWTITSDLRWKDEIRELPYGLNMISKLRPVDYIRKNNENKTREAGFIAQEVREILKELNYDDQGMLTEADDGFLSLRYNDLIPILVKAIQEQQAHISEQDIKLQNITSELEKVNHKMNEIQAHLKL